MMSSSQQAQPRQSSTRILIVGTVEPSVVVASNFFLGGGFKVPGVVLDDVSSRFLFLDLTLTGDEMGDKLLHTSCWPAFCCAGEDMGEENDSIPGIAIFFSNTQTGQFPTSTPFLFPPSCIMSCILILTGVLGWSAMPLILDPFVPPKSST
jgi:hypothetical protein